jgi:Na+-translocating ferredoxin:NAD+ oxidoreductase subunit G
MRDMMKMVIVLTVLASFSGGLLASIRNGTKERIEVAQLNFVKGPAINEIMVGSSNDPVADRFKMNVGETETEMDFFIGKFDGKAKTVALEGFGKGYGGDVGVMVAIDVENDTIYGVSVTTHAETPGMGAKAKEDPSFVSQFKGKSIDSPIKITNDGGPINIIGGSTITSRAVANAATEASQVYLENKDEILEKMKTF